MKQKFLFQLLVMPMLILSATALSSHAARDYHDLHGIEAPISAARHMIVMLPNTKCMNVRDGAIVTFITSGKLFTWLFNGPPHLGSFDLNVVNPSNCLDYPVWTYVPVNPRRLDGSPVSKTSR